ncbi:hypothetical protein AAMO2058_000305400 [Amorphochlora amoebiformis]|mmetsp:Transcript_33821/g.54466  ORF Transcript_33821/g.54466 Transcript_33821/m.54466 type:complete len:521 (-) Transcript_33821:143-1705(-)
MCLACFLHSYGKWVPENTSGLPREGFQTFSERCRLSVSGYFFARSFLLVLLAFSVLANRDIQGTIEAHYNSQQCTECYTQATANPATKYELSYCRFLNETRFPLLGNTLPKAPRENLLSPRYSDVQYFEKMNQAQISIWTIIFGMWALVTVIERVIGWSFPAMAGLTLLHRSRANYLRVRDIPRNTENMCAFGVSENLVRLAATHFRTVASVLTLPITIAVVNENYRFRLDGGGCYVDVGYRHQDTTNILFYVTNLGFELFMWISILLGFLVLVCYCCRKHIYELIRICFIVFFIAVFSLNFIAVFFLFANVISIAGKATDNFHIGFVISATLSLFEVEWIVFTPLLFKIRKHRQNMKLLQRFQPKSKKAVDIASQCRMIALLSGLQIPKNREGIITSQDGNTLGSTISNIKTEERKDYVVEMNSLEVEDKTNESDWSRPLEAMARDPLFDRHVFTLINEFQSSEDGTEVPIGDYVNYRLWKGVTPVERKEIMRIKRKISKHKWEVWDEQKGVAKVPMFV